MTVIAGSKSMESFSCQNFPERIVLATVGRFHYGRLAAELASQNRLKMLFTGLPKYSFKVDGTPMKYINSVPWFQTPYHVAMKMRILSANIDQRWARQAQKHLDLTIARKMPECDLYAALSGCSVVSGVQAKQRGARYVCERLSTHIRFQDQLLKAEHENYNLPYVPIEIETIEREELEYDAADLIVVPSNYVYESFVNQGVDESKLRIVPLSVRLDNWYSEKSRDKEFRILFVGQMTIRKGLGYLAKAVHRASFSKYKLVLIGARSKETRQLLSGLNEDNMELLGLCSQEEVRNEMSRASVVVLPSIEDGFGLTILEAMASGCPVIASNSCGVSELIRDGIDGYVVPAGDAELLADRLTTLYNDRLLVEQMGIAAAEHARECSNMESVTSRWLRSIRQSTVDFT